MRFPLAVAAVFVAVALPRAVAADELPSEDTLAVAAEAGVDALDLQGALNTMQDVGVFTDAREYAYATSLLARPAPPPPPVRSVAIAAPPAIGASASRLACIERKESGGANIPNRGGSGAGGVMQYMEPTFRAHAAEMGHPEWSRWNPAQARAVAAHDLAMGRRGQWTVAGC